MVQPSAYPTDIYARAIAPADAACISTYGEVGAILDNVRQGFATILSGENAPNPHEVAEEIARLVEQPGGSRPARVIVGAPFGADILNTTAAAVQTQALGALGLGDIILAADRTPSA